MSEINIYDETENLISSDEYSEEDDELMNTAVSSRNQSVKPEYDSLKLALPRPRLPSSVSSVKIPIRKKWLFSYKKKSIKWLNSKEKREKCKQLLSNIRKSNRASQVAHEAGAQRASAPKTLETALEEVDKMQKGNMGITSEVVVVCNNEKVAEVTNGKINYKKKPNNIGPENTSISNKRSRSSSPPNTDSNNSNEAKKHQQADAISNVSIYKELNEMYPKHDEIIGKQIKGSNAKIDAIEENMTRLLLDIQTLNDILQSKEAEWNKLLHLKKVKEEILNRLVRTKHILEINEKHIDEKKYSLRELRELEMYLSNNNTPASSAHGPAHHLIECRANMKPEDLEKERANTNRLQSILISNNILQRIDNHNANAAKYNVLPKSTTTLPTTGRSEEPQSFQYLESAKAKTSNRGRQGTFRDVKSIIADFRQQNPEMLPRVGKRIKINDQLLDSRSFTSAAYTSDIDGNCMYPEKTFESSTPNYAPTLEKLLSTSARASFHHPDLSSNSQGFKFVESHKPNHFKLHNNDLFNEVSITPVACGKRYLQKNTESKAELLRSALDVKSSLFEMSDYGKTLCKNWDKTAGNEAEVQLCQECRIHEAKFVCAGCSNQWYCSRNCQITAWDKHSEVCSE